MRVRLSETPEALGHSRDFNTHSLSEVIVYYDDGDTDSEDMKNLEVWLSCQQWWPMSMAFKQRRLIPDNYYTNFREPKNEMEMDRGWYDS